jgi:hypothetical protein
MNLYNAIPTGTGQKIPPLFLPFLSAISERHGGVNAAIQGILLRDFLQY